LHIENESPDTAGVKDPRLICPEEMLRRKWAPVVYIHFCKEESLIQN
jgi:hypothetical protein